MLFFYLIVPPAFSIFSFAASEKAIPSIVSFLVISPFPRIFDLTILPFFTSITPASLKDLWFTISPSEKFFSICDKFMAKIYLLLPCFYYH